MRLGDEPESSNFEDRTGSPGGMGFGGGGNLLGCLIPLVMSRFGIVGVVILLLGYCVLTQFGGGTGGLLPSSGPQQSAPAGQSTLSPETTAFLKRVLGSTEQTWGEIFAKSNERYTPTKLVAYTSGTQTSCGFGQAAMDRSIARTTRTSTSTLPSSMSFRSASAPLGISRRHM
jgi:hypothetical protein